MSPYLNDTEIGPISADDVERIRLHHKINANLIFEAFVHQDSDALMEIAKQLVDLGVRLKNDTYKQGGWR